MDCLSSKRPTETLEGPRQRAAGFPSWDSGRFRINDECSAANGSHEAALIVAGEERVPVAPHQKSRRGDPIQLLRIVIGHHGVERRAPEPRRQLAALRDNPIEERFGKRNISGGRLEIARELRGDGIRETLQRGPHFAEDWR